MFYLDTSIIVAYYCPEPLSEKVENIITDHAMPAISSLTELELFSAISKKIREGSMDCNDGNKIIAQFLAHMDDLFYDRLPIESHHYTLARDWIGRFTSPLRSLDAIHLAVASLSASTLITADKSLAKSAEMLSVDVYLIK